MDRLPTTRSCFACGRLNPVGLKLEFESDGQIVRTRWIPEPVHAGFTDTIHGGLLSTILDEVMVWACGVRTKRLAYCAELTVRFVQPARPGTEIIATGRMTADRRKLFEAAGELIGPGDVVLATATGKYLPLKAADMDSMLADFEADFIDGFNRTR